MGRMEYFCCSPSTWEAAATWDTILIGLPLPVGKERHIGTRIQASEALWIKEEDIFTCEAGQNFVWSQAMSSDIVSGPHKCAWDLSLEQNLPFLYVFHFRGVSALQI